jgi:hypothetical protein
LISTPIGLFDDRRRISVGSLDGFLPRIFG